VPVTAELEPVPSQTVLGHTFPDLDYGPTIGFELALEYRAEHVDLDASGWPPVEESTAEPAA
jgi:hypothetical protein